MALLAFIVPTGRPAARHRPATHWSTAQRLVTWLGQRLDRAVTQRLDQRLARDAGLASPDAGWDAGSPGNRHILWGFGVRRSILGLT